MTHDAFLTLRNMFGRLADLPNPVWAEFEQLCSVRRLTRGEHLAFAGDRFQDLLFVADGLLRFYYTDAAGRERNKSFDPAGTFCGPIASYLYDEPTPYSIQALEPSIVLSIGWRAFVNLCERRREMERALLRLLAEVLARKERRERMFLELDPPARYLAFLKESPELAERLPNYHIASYLGITEVSLSRIRGRLARAKRDGVAARHS
jgi:CRP-like cAMP-binding protein